MNGIKGISRIFLIALGTAAIILGNEFKAEAEEEYVQAPLAMHLHSSISDGIFSVSEIAKLAKTQGIKILIFTDYDLVRIEYGLGPLRQLVRKTFERNSVSKYGITRYIRQVELAQKENPDLVLIPSVEVIPFYYWEGNPFRNGLKLYDWHKHMLVVGLKDAKDYRNLLVISNPNNSYRRFKIWLAWPILTLVLGVLCLKRRAFDYTDFEGRALGPYSRPWQVFGIAVVVLSLVFLFNNIPFVEFKYDPYRGNQGIGPYQDLIDYVNTAGGLTFWAHPEHSYKTKFPVVFGRFGREVELETKEYSQDLLEAKDYTGFAIVSAGSERVAANGGIWDAALKEYCEGRRRFPVWAVGEMGFGRDENSSRRLAGVRTILLLRRLSREDVLAALKAGRMYVVRGQGTPEPVLDKFVVKEALSSAERTMGEEMEAKGKIVVGIHGRVLNNWDGQIKINLIRSGALIKTFELTGPVFDIDYEDDYFKPGERIYYRIEVLCGARSLLTNPIFVKFAK